MRAHISFFGSEKRFRKGEESGVRHFHYALTMFASIASPFTQSDIQQPSPFFFTTEDTPSTDPCPQTHYASQPHTAAESQTQEQNGVMTHAPVSPSCSGQKYTILPLESGPEGDPFMTSSSVGGVGTTGRGERSYISGYGKCFWVRWLFLHV